MRIMVVLIPFCFRLVNKCGIVIVPGLTKYSELKVMLEGTPVIVSSYNRVVKHVQLLCLFRTE